jgi:formylglycine-generating enzyme required for sulfatase activity
MIGIAFVLALVSAPPQAEGKADVPAGCFVMGNDSGDVDERPAHEVCLESFRMDRHEVTNAQFEALLGKNPHWGDGECFVWSGVSWRRGVLPQSFRESRQPAVCVEYDQARAYCAATGGRLPTEAEWEYAARAGSHGRLTWKEGAAGIATHAWIMENGGYMTHSVAAKLPNAWGLYDMLGNAWEWTADWYGAGYYEKSPRKAPTGLPDGAYRTYRGGGWFTSGRLLSVSARGNVAAQTERSALGFRCVEDR